MKRLTRTRSFLVARNIQLGLLGLMLLAGLLGAGIAQPRHAFADANNFTVTDFSADYYLNDNDPQGQMRVVEHIKVDFTDQNHGLLRSLPKSYSGQNLHLKVNQVSSDSGAPDGYTTYDSNGNEVLKIGDANRTITGSQEYTVDYTVSNVLKFYSATPQLFWNINGTGWSQPFDHVAATLHLPHTISVDGRVNQPTCYSGTYGSTDKSCMVTADSATHTLKVESTQALPAYGAISLVTNLSGSGLHPQNWKDWVSDYWKAVAAVLVMPVIIFAYCYTIWSKRGRDAKGAGTIVPEYDAPEGMTPADVNEIDAYKVDSKAITATIIGLAIRKHIRIIESKKEHFIGKDTLSYELELLNSDFSTLTGDEQKILHGLFADPQVGAKHKIEAASSSLAKVVSDISKDTSDRLTAAGYFKANPRTSATAVVWPIIIIIGGVFLFGTYLNATAVIGGAISVVIMIVFARIMPARSEKGAAAEDHIKGLKLYLETAEADRIKMLQSPNAEYASNHDEPVKTVELFEKLLPFAIVLGVETAWAGQFQNLYVTPPDWYSGYGGNMAAFNAGYLAGSLGSNFQNAVNTSFSAPSSSGGSGFGGGGFSGGGGGGGGGGGW